MADYAQPIQVNGYSCKNCTDVDYAKKHIDPAHPKDGPYGIDKAGAAEQARSASHGAAVILGGKVAALLSAKAIPPSSSAANTPQAVGGRVDVFA